MTPRPLVVFADDWGRHPSSCQHLVRRLLPTRPVVWCNTIGTRPPRLDWGTATRVAGKLKEWVSGPRERAVEAQKEWVSGPRERAVEAQQDETNSPLTRAAHPRVVAPKMWPSFRSAFGRSLNRRLLVKQLRPVIESLPVEPIIVTTLPLVADLIGRLPAHRWVYYCVDDFGVWPGYDGETMLRMERDLVPKVDAIVAVSETLQRHVADLGKSSHLLTHGVDLAHWKTTSVEPLEYEKPIVLFWGVIDRRMDTAFVAHLSKSLMAGTILLVGPQEDPDPELLRLPRVVAQPPMPFDQLPGLAAAADVLVMPYVDAPVTRAMQPLKMKEYLATGKPAVVRSLPASRPWADGLDVAETAEQFTELVIQNIASGLPAEKQAARSRLAAEGWDDKAKQFAAWIDG